MKTQICILFFFATFLGCNKTTQNNTISNHDNREVLMETVDFEVHGQMVNGLLNDTLKYFRKDTLYLIQVWSNGTLKSNSVNDNGEIRRLEYVNEQIDSVSYSVYYRDINDSSFVTLPFDQNIFKFYDSIKVLTDTVFKENKPTVFRILNVPLKFITVAVAGGTAKLENEDFKITPSRKSGETIKIQILYDRFYKTEFKEYTIQE